MRYPVCLAPLAPTSTGLTTNSSSNLANLATGLGNNTVGLTTGAAQAGAGVLQVQPMQTQQVRSVRRIRYLAGYLVQVITICSVNYWRQKIRYLIRNQSPYLMRNHSPYLTMG